MHAPISHCIPFLFSPTTPHLGNNLILYLNKVNSFAELFSNIKYIFKIVSGFVIEHHFETQNFNPSNWLSSIIWAQSLFLSHGYLILRHIVLDPKVFSLMHKMDHNRATSHVNILKSWVNLSGNVFIRIWKYLFSIYQTNNPTPTKS